MGGIDRGEGVAGRHPTEGLPLAARLMDDVIAVGGDIAQRVDLIIVLAVRKGGELVEQLVEARHCIRNADVPVIKAEEPFVEPTNLEIVRRRASHGLARQHVAESLRREVLIDAPADAVAVHNDEGWLLEAVEPQIASRTSGNSTCIRTIPVR